MHNVRKYGHDLQEKCIEQKVSLYMVFVGFTEAFDIMNRETLQIILRKLGCRDYFVKLVSALNIGMRHQSV